MKRVKVMFASAMDTVHALGASGLASCLLTKSSFVGAYRVGHALVAREQIPTLSARHR